MEDLLTNQQITQRQKEANDNAYYKQHLDSLDKQGFQRNSFTEGVSEFDNMKVNYDIIANKINLSDFSKVCKPFGEDVGEMPADMANHDIVTSKFKKVIGMEAKRPFGYSCIAVNEDATTRKEEFENGKMTEFVISTIMSPIQQQIELKYQEQLKGSLSPDDKQKIQQQIQAETEAMTPPQVRDYMARKHQDPVEVLNNQILRYLEQSLRIKDKFLKGFKHAMAAGREIFLVGIANNNPFLRVVNPLYFDYGKTTDSESIEDSEWAVAEFHETLSALISQFRKQLTSKQIKNLYEYYRTGSPNSMRAIQEDMFKDFDTYSRSSEHIRVLYGTWKSERKVGFLDYYDDNKEPQSMMVSENYVLNIAMGDISLEWEWIPEVHHGYKICLGDDPIYIGLGAVPGQHRDLDNLHICKLPFIGVDYDDLNSNATSLVDRLKVYQYYYNIIMYRIQLLMASDKGKILMMNMNMIPVSAGIDLKKFQYFMESNKIVYYNPNEEGNKKGTADVNTVGKVIDLSLASDIMQYINMAEYIEKRSGDSVGIPKAAEGQTTANESVRNVQQNLSQSSDILEPYFQLHNAVKREVLQKLVDVAKVAYGTGKPRKISYVLDDMSQSIINLDEKSMSMLDSSTLGIFVTDSTSANEAKQMVTQLAHSAMQTQQIDLLDVVKIIRSDDIQAAEEKLEVGTERKAKQLGEQQQAAAQANAQQEEAKRAWEKEKMGIDHTNKMAEIKAKGQIDIKKQAMLSMGFNEDKDMDNDGTPDVLEVAKFGVDADIKAKEIALKEKESDRNYSIEKEKLAQNDKKLEIEKSKAKKITT